MIDTDTATIVGADVVGQYSSEVLPADAGHCTSLAVIAAERIVISGRVRVQGANALALVATTDLTVEANGWLDVSAEAESAGPGGYSGGVGQSVGGGPGADGGAAAA